jgi:ssDNA-specific exonuclease RecJ
LRFYNDVAGFEELGCDLFYPSSRNLSNLLIVSPTSDAELGGYRDFIFLDTPSDFNVAVLTGKTVYVNKEICGYKMFAGLDTARESLLNIFAALRREVNNLNGETVEELTATCGGLGFDKREFIFAVSVFEELGLVAFKDGKLIVYRGVKADLNSSRIYTQVSSLRDF